MMEQSRQARKFFDLAWFGIGAAGAVDPMAAFAAATEVEFALQVFSDRLCKNHLTVLLDRDTSHREAGRVNVC